MARLSALSMAVLVHSVLGISYYHYFRQESVSASLLGAWLFSACVVALLQAIKIFPTAAPAPNPVGQRFRGGGRVSESSSSSSSWNTLLMETVICCLALDVALTQLWQRIESLCHCAIIGVLQALAVEERTFLACEYWTLGLTTGLIGGSLLWLTLKVTLLPSNVNCSLSEWRRYLIDSGSAMIFGTAPQPHPSPKRIVS